MIDVPPYGATIHRAGDSGVLLELPAIIDPAINARVIAIAAAVREAAIPGVRDVVSTYRSVAVHFDPLRVDVEEIVQRMALLAQTRAGALDGPLHELPIVYGGDGGPDLAAVAAWAGMSVDEVVRRHCGTTYRVFMLGFLPGFAYLGLVDPAIAAPRRATPRLKVPAGSVGIAGGQTGVYPMASPGGWQIVGATTAPLFDPSATPAATLSSGDRVRFVPSSTPQRHAPAVPSSPRQAGGGTRMVTVIAPGLFTTVQDSGRWGYQHLGVPVAGPMDVLSHRLANRLVGNPEDAATLEATLLGPELRFDASATIAVTGGDLAARVDDHDVAPGTVHRVAAGSVLRFGLRRRGARAYVACDGGIAITPVLGSRATHALCRIGGFEGRALRAGDRIELGPPMASHPPRPMDEKPVPDWMPQATGGARVRVRPGPQAKRFSAESFGVLERERFMVSSESNRMGYRLTGVVIPPPGGEMISDATFPGSVQVPPSGEAILLMADRQTTGGYAQIATVIGADLPVVGQLAPGDWIEFSICGREEAMRALIMREGALARLA